MSRPKSLISRYSPRGIEPDTGETPVIRMGETPMSRPKSPVASRYIASRRLYV